MSKKNQPRVSVVIKSYNHASFVCETIQSILDQSFQDFEIVITDDGSTDGTLGAIREFADPRIDLQVFEQNQGISAAMNATIVRARGEFIAILNSDDFALPGRLDRQVAFLDSNPGIAAVFGLPQTIDEYGQETESFFDFTIPLSLPDFSRTTWLRHFFLTGNCLCAPTAMIRRAVYKQVGAYDPRLNNLSDLDMWVRICAEHDIHVLSDELTAFRIRADNLNASAPSREAQLRHEFEYFQVLNRYRAMKPEFLREIFTGDLGEKKTGTSLSGSHDLWLVELALKAHSPAHRLFALETLYEVAKEAGDLRRLRELTGDIDLFGILSRIEHDNQIAALRQEVDERGRVIKAFYRSRSWRLTAPLRWMRSLVSTVPKAQSRTVPRDKGR